MKITAVAHPIQGLMKYHGLLNPAKRIPFHDSISVCEGALSTTTTVESDPSIEADSFEVNGAEPSERETERIRIVVDAIRNQGRSDAHLKVKSENSLRGAKGVGFSASGMAALGYAANSALEVGLSDRELSEAVRLGAGSATRSLAGGFAIWYADRDGGSYAERLSCPTEDSFRMLIAPIQSNVKTEQAHREVLTSPFFTARIRSVRHNVKEMASAVRSGDLVKVCEMAEFDSLSLHAVTMTGSARMVLWEPKTIEIINVVRRLREEEGVPCWFSIDTGPSVFINTHSEHVQQAKVALKEVAPKIIESSVGGAPQLVNEHLF
jgi:phosphomevalonate decarboxylase